MRKENPENPHIRSSYWRILLIGNFAWIKETNNEQEFHPHSSSAQQHTSFTYPNLTIHLSKCLGLVPEGMDTAAPAAAVMPNNVGEKRSSSNKPVRERQRSGRDNAWRRWWRSCGAANKASVRWEAGSNWSEVLNENRCTSYVRSYPN